MKEQTEPTYVLNITYLVPYFESEGNKANVSPTMSQLAFDNEEKALDIFTKIKTEKFFEVDSEAGKFAFSVIAIELVNIKKYKESLEANTEVEEVDGTNDK